MGHKARLQGNRRWGVGRAGRGKRRSSYKTHPIFRADGKRKKYTLQAHVQMWCWVE